MISGIILLALAALFWFGLATDESEEASTGFVKIVKGILGVKGYKIMAKVLAAFMVAAACAEFYKYFTN
jgi:hypothetical protein